MNWLIDSSIVVNDVKEVVTKPDDVPVATTVFADVAILMDDEVN